MYSNTIAESRKTYRTHVMKAGRDFQRSSNPISCSNQVQLEQRAQGCVQLSFDHPQGWRFHNPSQHLFQYLPASMTKKKKKGYFLELIVISCVATCRCLLSYHCAFLRRVWPHCCYALPLGSCRQQQDHNNHSASPLAFFFFNLEEIQFSVSPL